MDKTKLLLGMLFTCFLSSITSVSQATEENYPRRRVSESLDMNRNEVVSFVKFKEANFKRMDHDGNGVLSAYELQPAQHRSARGIWSRGSSYFRLGDGPTQPNF